MKNRFREARKAKKIKSADVMKALGISQPTLSSWEIGQRFPSLDRLCQLADLYGVTTDYLLGRPAAPASAEMERVPLEVLPALHGQPVWSPEHGWLLVNALTQKLEGMDGEAIPFSESGELSMSPPVFFGTHAPLEPPLEKDQVLDLEKVWVEPLSCDLDLCQELRGWYCVRKDFAENSTGNRFFLDTYGAKWLAFGKSPTE